MAALHLLQLLATMLLLASANVASRNCTSRCGSVRIPYPFGVGAGCHREGFELTCNETSDPPRLFLDNAGVQVLGISVKNGTLLIDGGVVSLTGNVTDEVDAAWEVPLNGTLYAVSAGVNRAAVLGCGFMSLLVGESEEVESARCRSHCVPGVQIPTDGTCSRNGCCNRKLLVDRNRFHIKFSQSSDIS